MSQTMSQLQVERSFPPYYLEHRERYTTGGVRQPAPRLASGATTWDTLQQDDAVEVAGDPEVLARFLGCFELTPPRVQLHAR